MAGYLYILECNDGTFYTGSTINLENRFNQHQSGCGANYTKKRRPLKLVFYQQFTAISDAFYYEKKIQKWSHAKKKAIVNNQWELLPELSKCKNGSYMSKNKRKCFV